MRKLLPLFLAILACKGPDKDDPAEWQKRLDSPDSKERIEAVRNLRRLKAKQAAPKVAALLKDPLVKEDAALALQDVGSAAEIPALLDAIETTVGSRSETEARTTHRANTKIAEAIGDIAAQGPVDLRATEALLRLARSKDDMVRLQAVQALGQVKDKSAVPELSRLVDDEATPPLIVKKAIVSLGEIGDPAAIPALEHGLVVERQGVSFFPEASFALYLIGQPAADALLKLLDDQDPQYLAWAKERDRSSAGTYAKAAIVLGDLGDPRAVAPLQAKLKYTDPDPSPGTARILTNFVRQFAAAGLGRLRAREAAPAIQALVSTKDPQDTDLAAVASEALVLIGDRAQARELSKKAQAGALQGRILVARAAALFGEPALEKEVAAIAAREEKGAPQACAKALAELGAKLDEPKQACLGVAARFSELSQAYEAARACAQDTACWTLRLKDKSEIVRTRAAFELGRLNAAAAVPPLFEVLKDDDPDVREAGALALQWLTANPAAREALKARLPALNAQLSADAGKNRFLRVDEELRRLQVKVARL